ncbi:MAG: segregation ATPase FtsK/SpoIIIE, family [Thermodesulfobacteriota bacterium]|nr:segregation ATPase FtsK/SpoIIIE, family [Thermodesulfobacteriota bacterium]
MAVTTVPMTEKPATGKRRAEIIGVICFAAGLFLVLCLGSYNPHDPSFTRFLPGEVQVHNLIGTFGAYTSDSLFRLIGLSAFFLPVVLFICSFKFFLNGAFRLTAPHLGGAFLFLLSFSGLSALVVQEVQIYQIPLRAGGLLGNAVHFYLTYYFNLAGASILLLLMLILAFMLMIHLSLVSLANWFLNRLKRGWQRMQYFSSGLIKKQKPIPSSIAPPREPALEALREPTLQTTPRIDEPVLAPEKARLPKAKQTHFEFFPVPGTFTLPPLELLDEIERRDTRMKKEILIGNASILEKKLADFGVEGKVVEVHPGPIITLYELEPAPGVKINRITNLSDDLALALKAASIRIIAPIPGKAVIGIEIPNLEREAVHLRDVLDSQKFSESRIKLPIALGVDIMGSPVINDLARMPHLLIAGTTGSGKSVSLNAMICSILFKATPEEVKFLMIDPKRIELSAYEGIPHLLHPVVVDPKKAAQVLKWAVEEMERRYTIISAIGGKSIEAYNKQAEKEKNPRLPYIVIVIDELADLMLVAPRNVEESLARIAQMARAAGIHLIIATQRPSVDVITGVIKANFPTRISFQVSSKVDSRTILDQLGAEALLGAGDMLFIPPGTSKLTRIHGAFVADREIKRVVEFLEQQAKPDYDASITEYETSLENPEREGEAYDEKYDEAVELVTDLKQASISLVQRYMKIGYNRAARIIERMEADGVVGPSDGVKPRKVLARKLSPD